MLKSSCSTHRGREGYLYENIKEACAVLAATFAIGAGAAHATVVTFDSLSGAGTVADGYGGIQWNGNWQYYDSPQDPYNPASGAERVYPTNNDVSLADFTFLSPVTFDELTSQVIRPFLCNSSFSWAVNSSRPAEAWRLLVCLRSSHLDMVARLTRSA